MIPANLHTVARPAYAEIGLKQLSLHRAMGVRVARPAYAEIGLKHSRGDGSEVAAGACRATRLCRIGTVHGYRGIPRQPSDPLWSLSVLQEGPVSGTVLGVPVQLVVCRIA